MNSEFRIIKSLEWCPELPSANCPKKFDVFTVNGNEWLFRFALECPREHMYYNLYLEVKCKNMEFEPCRFKLQVGFKEEETLSLSKQTCELSEPCNKLIWYINEYELKSMLPFDYGNGIKFLFCFDNTAEHLVKISEKNEDKCVQTVSYLNTDVSVRSLSNDFSELLDSGLNHDAEIKCGKDSIKAHKNVLCARSEVFKAMLESDMLEGRTGMVEVQDMDISCVRDFVRYLYTEAMPEMTFDKAKALYEAGDKYDVRSLMFLCSEYLQDNLTPENAYQCLALADIHSDRKLKERIIIYILDENIYLQDEFWLPVCENYPRIAVEVCRLLHKSSAENATTASSNASAFMKCQFSEPRKFSSETSRQIPGSTSSTNDIYSNFVFFKSEAPNTTSNHVPVNTVRSFVSTSTNCVPSKSETLNATSSCVSENIVPSFESTDTNFGISKSETLNEISCSLSENAVSSFVTTSNSFVPSKSETLNAHSSSVSENTASSFGSTSTNFVLAKSENSKTTSSSESENSISSFEFPTNFVLSKRETLAEISSCVSDNTVPSFESASTNLGLSKSEISSAISSSESENTVSSFDTSTNFVFGTKNDDKRTATAAGFCFGTPNARECNNPNFNFGTASTPFGPFMFAVSGAANSASTVNSAVRRIRKAKRRVRRE